MKHVNRRSDTAGAVQEMKRNRHRFVEGFDIKSLVNALQAEHDVDVTHCMKCFFFCHNGVARRVMKMHLPCAPEKTRERE
jgi:hypothetical protein